ncbi:MAG: peptidoglycan-binding protein [Desulfuromonadales bacterium]|nr:peptidoglycan-binding protein [Desulfuromonadales bacterium]
MASIAEKHGFFWETLWNLPENSDLKRGHEDQTILLPGEIVRIPDLREKEESGATEQKHRFKRNGTPAILRLQVLRPIEPEEEEPTEEEPSDEGPPEDDSLEVVVEDPTPQEGEGDEPWADAPYILEIDGKVTEGQTDGDGKIEEQISPAAQKGRLKMEPGTERELVMTLRLGHLDPVTSIPGIADRLNNLGLFDGSRPAEMTSELSEALLEFQKVNELEESGEVDQATRDKLKELHGS